MQLVFKWKHIFWTDGRPFFYIHTHVCTCTCILIFKYDMFAHVGIFSYSFCNHIHILCIFMSVFLLLVCSLFLFFCIWRSYVTLAGSQLIGLCPKRLDEHWYGQNWMWIMWCTTHIYCTSILDTFWRYAFAMMLNLWFSFTDLVKQFLIAKLYFD